MRPTGQCYEGYCFVSTVTKAGRLFSCISVCPYWRSSLVSSIVQDLWLLLNKSWSSFYGKQVLRARSKGRRKRNAKESTQKAIFTRRNHYIQMYTSHGCFYPSPSHFKLRIWVIFLYNLDFLERSLSVEKRLVSPHVSARLPQDGFSQNLILETCTKICRENPNLV